MVVSSKKKRNDRFGKLENAKLMSGIRRFTDIHGTVSKPTDYRRTRDFVSTAE